MLASPAGGLLPCRTKFYTHDPDWPLSLLGGALTDSRALTSAVLLCLPRHRAQQGGRLSPRAGETVHSIGCLLQNILPQGHSLPLSGTPSQREHLSDGTSS